MQIEGIAFSVEGLRRDADEIEACGGGNEAAQMRWAADEIERLSALNDHWQNNQRDQFDALCAMRNDLNEILPIQHLDADLRKGPETSVFCAAVVEAVRAAFEKRKS